VQANCIRLASLKTTHQQGRKLQKAQVLPQNPKTDFDEMSKSHIPRDLKMVIISEPLLQAAQYGSSDIVMCGVCRWRGSSLYVA
jgi:hypothetical protein